MYKNIRQIKKDVDKTQLFLQKQPYHLHDGQACTEYAGDGLCGGALAVLYGSVFEEGKEVVHLKSETERLQQT